MFTVKQADIGGNTVGLVPNPICPVPGWLTIALCTRETIGTKLLKNKHQKAHLNPNAFGELYAV